MKKRINLSWILKVIKGALIGSGFILPGISGGALAAVFGIYERIIAFLANPFKNLRQNIWYFLPIGLGALLGIFLLSFAVSYLLGNYANIVVWFFIGAIVGTIPALWRQAGQVSRNMSDIVVTVVGGIVMLLFLIFGAPLFSHMEPSFGAWLLAGALIGLGLIIPGLSPSNFLLYLGLYKGMSDGIKNGNLGVLIPIIIGLLVILAALSKVMEFIFQHAHAKMFHLIFGIVIASTVMIIPTDYSNFSVWAVLISIVMLVLGVALGWWMSALEETVK